MPPSSSHRLVLVLELASLSSLYDDDSLRLRDVDRYETDAAERSDVLLPFEAALGDLFSGFNAEASSCTVVVSAWDGAEGFAPTSLARRVALISLHCSVSPRFGLAMPPLLTVEADDTDAADSPDAAFSAGCMGLLLTLRDGGIAPAGGPMRRPLLLTIALRPNRYWLTGADRAFAAVAADAESATVCRAVVVRMI